MKLNIKKHNSIFSKIEKKGEVTTYGFNEVVMEDGFEIQEGGEPHAYVHCDGCSRPREQGMKTNNGENNQNRIDENYALKVEDYDSNNDKHQKTVLKVYPNPSDNGFTIEFPEVNGDYTVTNTNGKNIQENKVLSKSIFIELPKGMYFLKWINKNGIQTKKIIAL
jgi:hypothetical protein